MRKEIKSIHLDLERWEQLTRIAELAHLNYRKTLDKALDYAFRYYELWKER